MIVMNSECMFFYSHTLENTGFNIVPNLYPHGYYPNHLLIYLRDEEGLSKVKIELWQDRELITVLGDYGLTVKQLEGITKYAKRTANEIEWEDDEEND